MTNRPQLDDVSQAFVLLEFETMRDMRAALNTQVAAEIQIYVAMVTAMFVALAFIAQFFEVTTTVLLIALGALGAVVLLGWATYYRVVESRITVVRYARSLNRVRRYFVTRNATLTEYVSPDVDPNAPPFGAVGATRPILGALKANTGLVAIIKSGSAAAGVGIATSLFGITNRAWVIVLVLLAFLVSIAIHDWYQMRRYSEAETAWCVDRTAAERDAATRPSPQGTRRRRPR